MKILASLILLFVASPILNAQPRHIGALASGQFEGSGSGNGSIIGAEVQNVHPVKWGDNYFKIISNVSLTADKKVYRNQFGGAVRLASLARYYDRVARLGFIQGGVNVAAIAFPNTPGQDDGYAKYTIRPVVGGGFAFNDPSYSISVDYQFLFKRKLLAQKSELSDFKNRFTDGWTSGQKLGLETTYNLSEKNLFLFNASVGWHTYQRNPAVYGAELGSVVHRFNAYTVSLGIGRKY